MFINNKKMDHKLCMYVIFIIILIVLLCLFFKKKSCSEKYTKNKHSVNKKFKKIGRLGEWT